MSLRAIVLMLLLAILSPIGISFIGSFEPALDSLSFVSDCSDEEENEDKDGEEEHESKIAEYLFFDPQANSFLSGSLIKHNRGFFALRIRFNDILVPPPRS
ncbi:MAG: hypothetical protein KDD41_13195 [Flavobacteriales bacterium]|nr:hypothetical protein [Flavobacteriales bacterium]